MGTSEQQRAMEAAGEAASVEGVTFHVLRHTYASHALMNGMFRVSFRALEGRRSRSYRSLPFKWPSLEDIDIVWNQDTATMSSPGLTGMASAYDQIVK